MRVVGLLAMFLLALSGSTAARAATERMQVLLLDLESVESEVPKDKVSILQGRIAATLSERSDLDLVTSGDLKAMTQLEADKSLAGCDQSGCLAEIAAALGARYVVFGRVSKLDENYLIAQLNLFDAQAARAVGRAEVTGSSLKELAEKMPASVQQLFGKLGATTTGAPPPTTTRAAGPWTIGGEIATSIGGLALVGGGVVAAIAETTLVSPEATLDAREGALNAGPIALWCAVAGGAVTVVGATVWAVGSVTE